MDEVLDIIAELVMQHCKKQPDGGYHSGFIGVNGSAIRLLGEHGRARVVDGAGRGATAYFNQYAPLLGGAVTRPEER
jgi:hypothetical protein